MELQKREDVEIHEMHIIKGNRSEGIACMGCPGAIYRSGAARANKSFDAPGKLPNLNSGVLFRHTANAQNEDHQQSRA